MRFSQYIIILLVSLLVLTTFGGLFTHWAGVSEYNVTISEDFRKTYTNTTALMGIVEDTTGIGLNMTDSAKEAKQLEGDYEDPSKAQVKTMKIVWDSYDIVKGMLLGLSEIMHIPPIIIGIVLSLLVFGFLFAFISMIFRWRT